LFFGKLGAGRDVNQSPFVEKLGNVPSVPKSRRPDYSVAPFGSGLKRISRTSPDARPATAPLRAHARPSSISAASSSQKPPMCSLVAADGPSVTSTLPSGWARSDLALPAGERPQANFLAPAAINSRFSAWIFSIVASVSTDGS